RQRARRVADGRDWIELAVADSGSEFLEQLRLLIGGQADTSSGQRFGGAGLALAITRRLARMMGGDMTMASEPGKGSVFTVRLPGRIDAPARGSSEDIKPQAGDAGARDSGMEAAS